MHTTPDTSKVSHLYHYFTPLDIISAFQILSMAVFHDLRLMSLAVLMLASQLDFASAAVRVFGLHARDIIDAAGNKPDPYVKVWCGSTFGGQTEYIKDTAHPSWSAEFNFPNCKAFDDIKLELWDKDLNYDDKLGTCYSKVENGSFIVNCFLANTVIYRYEAK
ncbi:hypothetical protein ABG768_020942 [Culter alburnus]|uniref:C2 domain-containing protein n=1 Tax=Culter alburnus TaxID=194366 RepID=A0AAW2ASJ4_CULAL